MKLVTIFSVMLLLGMAGSQVLPFLPGHLLSPVGAGIQWLTMIGLAFIMVHVGYEFEIDKGALGQYGWDYAVAMTAAAFPWIFASAYFVFVMLPPDAWATFQAWKESLLTGRFAAPTSAGVLFSMLAAAGLSATWLFHKARILAIFDDLDTVLLMIPLKILMIGFAWHLGASILIMVALIWLAWRYMHRWPIPVTWPWVLGYAFAIATACELVYLGSKWIVQEPIHIEVLLPAFVVGCMMKRPAGANPHADDLREDHQERPENSGEQRVAVVVSTVFMVLVGLSMPPLFGTAAASAAEAASPLATLSSSQPSPTWGMMLVHVIVLTVLINLGKMFPLFCYRREAGIRERLALSIGLWPRGEVGAGVLILSLSYGIQGPMVTVAMLCLALNLAATGLYIVAVKRLVAC